MKQHSWKMKWVLAVTTLTIMWVLGVTAAFALELVPAGTVAVTNPKTSARGIALSLDESALYIGGIQDRTLVKVVVSSGAVTAADLTKIDKGAYGKAAWVDNQGRVWAPLTVPILAVYSPGLELEAAYDLKPFGITNPEGAIIGQNGEVYVTDRNKNKPGIFKFVLQNGQLAPVQSWGDNGYVKFTDLRVPVLTASGDLLMSNYSTGEIFLVKAADGSASVYLKGVKSPYYLALDNANLLYVAHYDRKDAALSVYGPDGSLLRSWSGAELGATTAISGIAVAKDGKRVYILDQQAPNALMMFDVK